MDSKVFVAFFGSSKRLLRLAEDIALQQNRNIKCYKYALDEAIEPAIKAVEEERAEVIVAYRGTAKLLRRWVHIPVLSIQNFSIYKMEAIRRLSRYAKHLFIPLTEYEMFDIKQLEELFHVKVHVMRYNSDADLERSIKEYKEQYGDGIVISGGRACRYASKYKLRHFLVVPDRQHIMEIIDNACSIAAANRENELWLRRAEALLSNVSDGVLAVDEQGFITLMNKQAYTLLGLKRGVLGQNIANVLPELANSQGVLQSQRYFLQQIGKTKFVFNYAPLEVRAGNSGALFAFNSARQVIVNGKIVNRAISRGNKAKYTVQDYIHTSPVIDTMLQKLQVYARSNSTVLITGNSGTGKEILAHALHSCSPRHNKPFVSINCAAIPEQLLESELFGYEGGTFTGSLKEGKIGLFENADEGTIFIDEVNSLPLNVQLLLLRALQEKEIRRIGSDTTIPLNIRVIAATNKSLIDEVLKGNMREDLFFRLNVLVLEVPALQRHIEDIPVLVRHFVQRIARTAGLPVIDIPEACLEQLMGLPWPGNIRELEHFVERLVLLCNGLFNQDIFNSLFASTRVYQEQLAGQGGRNADGSSETGQTTQGMPIAPAAEDEKDAQTSTRKPLDRDSVVDALAKCRGRKGEAAKLLGVSRITLWRFLQKEKMA